MRFNMFAGIFWLFLGLTLLGARFLNLEIEGFHPDRVAFIGMFALVLAAWNFVRWWAARVRQKARNAANAEQPRKRQLDKPPLEYHPEFDFNRQDPPQK